MKPRGATQKPPLYLIVYNMKQKQLESIRATARAKKTGVVVNKANFCAYIFAQLKENNQNARVYEFLSRANKRNPSKKARKRATYKPRDVYEQRGDATTQATINARACEHKTSELKRRLFEQRRERNTRNNQNNREQNKRATRRASKQRQQRNNERNKRRRDIKTYFWQYENRDGAKLLKVAGRLKQGAKLYERNTENDAQQLKKARALARFNMFTAKTPTNKAINKNAVAFIKARVFLGRFENPKFETRGDVSKHHETAQHRATINKGRASFIEQYNRDKNSA